MLTADQQKSLKTWAEERDEILAALSPLRAEKDSLMASNQTLGQNNKALLDTIQKNTAKIELMENSEEERSLLISQELAGKILEKTNMESTLSILQKETEAVQAKKDEIEKSISVLLPILDRVTWQVSALNDTVAHVVGVNKENTNEVNILISNLKKALSDLGIKE